MEKEVGESSYARKIPVHTFCSGLLPLPAFNQRTSAVRPRPDLSNQRTPAIRLGSDLGRVPTIQSASSRGPAWSGQGRSTLGRVQHIAGVRDHNGHCLTPLLVPASGLSIVAEKSSPVNLPLPPLVGLHELGQCLRHSGRSSAPACGAGVLREERQRLQCIASPLSHGLPHCALCCWEERARLRRELPLVYDDGLLPEPAADRQITHQGVGRLGT